MKQLLSLFCIALLCSCGASKKATNTTKSNTDSTGTKSSSVVDVKKSETTGTTTSKETEKTQSEGSYKKTTTKVVEVFGGEFGFDGTNDTGEIKPFSGPAPSNDSLPGTAAKKPGKAPGLPYYRETTTTVEEGTQKQTKDASALQETAGKIVGSDSSAHENKQGSQVKTAGEAKQTSRVDLSLIPWGSVLLIALVMGIAFFIKIKFLK